MDKTPTYPSDDYIKNIGKSVLIAIMWSNQTFNKNKPDTVYKKISND